MKKEVFLLWQVKIGVILILLTPLVLGPFGISLAEFPKALYFRVLVEITLLLYLLLVLFWPKYLPRATPLFLLVTAFVGITLVSAAFGFNFFRSFFGDLGRGQGVILHLHLLALFVITTAVFRTKEAWFFLLRQTAVVSALVAAVGMLQYAGLFDFYNTTARISGTFTNPVFFGAYLTFTVFLAAILFVEDDQKRVRPLWPLLFLVQLFVLILAAARGAWLGVGVGLAVFVAVSLAVSRRSVASLFHQNLRTLLVAMTVLGLFGSALFYADTSSQLLGKIRNTSTLQERLLTWQVAWSIWQERPVLGWGDESFSYLFDTHFSPGGETLKTMLFFDRVHNKPLGVLVSNGALGLTAYLSLFAFAWYLLWRATPVFVMHPGSRVLFAALLLAYFIQNLFLFDNVATYLLFFLVLGFVNNAFSQPHLPAFPMNGVLHLGRLPKRAAGVVLLLGVAALALFALQAHYRVLKANFLLVQGARAEERVSTIDETFAKYQQAMNEPNLYQDDVKIAVAERVLFYFDEPSLAHVRYRMLALLRQAEEVLQRRSAQPDALSRHYLLLLVGINEKQVWILGHAPSAEEMEEVARQALALYPGRDQNVYMRALGEALLFQGHSEQGEAYYWEAAALESELSPVVEIETERLIGSAYMKTRNLKRAAPHFQRAFEIGLSIPIEDRVFASQVISLYHDGLQDTQNAKKLYDRALQAYSPENREWLTAHVAKALTQ